MLDIEPRGEIGVWSALMEALPEPIILVDPEIRVVAANRPARGILPSLRIGESLALALRTPDVLDSIRRVQGSGVPEAATWRERVPLDRVFEVAVAPLRAQQAGTIVLALRDLTEARSAERMRTDFVANASHELRTPLASLLGFVETLQGAARDDSIAREKFLGIMREQARRMARLVDDLLSLSRIEQNLHLRPADAVDLSSGDPSHCRRPRPTCARIRNCHVHCCTGAGPGGRRSRRARPNRREPYRECD